ncbi:MAG: hypothetical protein ACI97A_003618 [Planctomycetota bacterium]
MTNRTSTRSEYLVTALLVVAGILSAIQLFRTVDDELDRPIAHWGQPGFSRVSKILGEAEEVVFVTDEIGRRSANGRLNSCQFAAIPARLLVKHTRLEVLAEFEKGKWCIIDVHIPASIDQTEMEARTWAEQKGRKLIFERLSPKLAVFRSPNPKDEGGH